MVAKDISGVKTGNVMQVEQLQNVRAERPMPLATRSELEQAVEVARELRQRERFNKLDYYDPYP